MEIRYSQRVRQWRYNMRGYRSSICSIGMSALPSSFLPLFCPVLSFLIYVTFQTRETRRAFRLFLEEPERKF
jgi:hypothetical protein